MGLWQAIVIPKLIVRVLDSDQAESAILRLKLESLFYPHPLLLLADSAKV